MTKPKSKEAASGSRTIALNRKARHDYTIEETFEAGIVLQGWEVKSLRAGKGQIAESHVIIRKGEAWLIGSHIAPLVSASTHVKADADRTRKLLLHARELRRLIGLIERKGYTLIPLDLHWMRGNVKLTLAVAKGKKAYDKRADAKDKDWTRQKERLKRS